LPEKIKRGLGRLFGGGADEPEATAHERVPSEVSSELRASAAESIRGYAEDNETLFNRASRFEEKAERLQNSDGTTSESALRRAERAREEIREELSALRESFTASNGGEGKLAFDAELEAMYPQFAAPEGG
jgi:hypothetical protein